MAEVRLDKKTFLNFALYDTFVLKKHWIRPAVFCAVMTLFAIISLMSVNAQSWLMAGVLLSVGFGLPAVYVISFVIQVNSQSEKNHLSADSKIYTVNLNDKGIMIHGHRKKDEKLFLKWSDIAGIYRRRNCIYIYTDKNKAFLLPEGQSDVSDSELWEYISSKVSHSA